MSSDERKVKIQVNKITKIFGRNTRRALQLLKEGKSKSEILQLTGSTIGVKNASFNVYNGEIFVIMGLSGSGKSTLVRLLNRLIEPTSGEVFIDAEEVTQMGKDQLRDIRRKKISMVFQNFALFPHRTVLQNTEYGLEIQGVEKDSRKRQAMEALDLVGLKGYEDQYPNQLSGGMQQRVGLARALANNPDILLMDEAFSALDPLIRKDMQDELVQLQNAMEKTIVFITHDLDEALKIGDRIALMKDGQIVQIGSPEEILMNPSNEYVERFVEDVDLSKVLTAGHVMKRAEIIQLEKGPRVALKLMKSRGISSIYVVDRQNRLIGAVTAQCANEAVEKNLSLEDVLITNITCIPSETLLVDIFDVVSTTSIPVTVIDDEKRIKGIVIRGALIGALSGKGSYINNTDQPIPEDTHKGEVQ